MKTEIKQLREDVADLRALADRQSDLLTQTALALRGEAPLLTEWSHTDIPERARLLVNGSPSFPGSTPAGGETCQH